MSSHVLTYQVTARVVRPGVSNAAIAGKSTEIEFDSSAGQSPALFGPADLLVTAFAACVLKNVERMSTLQHFSYQGASIEVIAEREEQPPRIARIKYQLKIATDEPDRKMQVLHRNIARHGTIYNTLVRACEVTGELISVLPTAENPLQ